MSEWLISSADLTHQVAWSEFPQRSNSLELASDEFLWLCCEENASALDQIAPRVTPQGDIIQYVSDSVLQELLPQVTTTIRAALGFGTLIAISSRLLDEVVSQVGDVSPNVLLLELVNKAESWKVEAVTDLCWPLLSAIPASNASLDRDFPKRWNAVPDSELLTGDSDEISIAEIRAGILLIHDFLEPSHEFSQSIEGRGPDVNGDYWHGIMHRREPDFGNSRYWFRRVGQHPCFARLAEEAQEMVKHFSEPEIIDAVNEFCGSGWDSFAVVDFFQEAHRPNRRGTAWHEFAECLQMREMLILLFHCCS